MNDIYSFYQLISKYHIEIPIIQRDYAQGRKDTKATDVRKSIVDNMVCAVKDGKELFFDFVYGRVDGNKFIPFDGQQRLTTLFLFHKYLFEKCQLESDCNHKDNCICKDILYRFSYSTRQSSREFCNDIVSYRIIPGNDFLELKRNEYREKIRCNDEKEKKKKVQELIENKTDWISSYIYNQSWFYPDWEKDPTIMGMLAMLDEIHNQLKKETNFRGYAEKLTSGCSCPITFHFVDMGEYRLTDDTYVKMNARGKTLTPFENFKASLEQYLEENQKDVLLERLNDKIDGNWLDLFWIQANKDNKEKVIPDSMMMSFVNRHFINVWSCWYSQNINKHSEEEANQQKEYDDFDERIKKEMPLYPSKDNYVPWDIYQNVIEKCGIDNCLTPIFNIWDAVSTENKIEKDCQAVWNMCDGAERWNLYQGIKNNNTETYSSRVAFYALLRYYANETECNGNHLSQWMRVVWNIVENSTIDSSEPYQAALRLIDELSKHTHDICVFLSNSQSQIKSDFAKEQVLEEVAKAEKILNGKTRSDGKSWKKIIIDAERYEFFKGAIRFLFTDEEGNIKWCDFDNKWTNAQQFFPSKAPEKYLNTVEFAKYFEDEEVKRLWWNYCFDTKCSSWRMLLLSKYHKQIHDFMSAAHVDNTILIEDIKNLTSKLNTSLWIRKWNTEYCYLTNYDKQVEKPEKGYVYMVGSRERNEAICTIIKIADEDSIKFQGGIADSYYVKISDICYFRGLNVDFKYNSKCFRLWENNTICLMNDDWEDKKYKNQNGLNGERESYYFHINDINEKTMDIMDIMKQQLDNLINISDKQM